MFFLHGHCNKVISPGSSWFRGWSCGVRMSGNWKVTSSALRVLLIELQLDIRNHVLCILLLSKKTAVSCIILLTVALSIFSWANLFHCELITTFKFILEGQGFSALGRENYTICGPQLLREESIECHEAILHSTGLCGHEINRVQSYSSCGLNHEIGSSICIAAVKYVRWLLVCKHQLPLSCCKQQAHLNRVEGERCNAREKEMRCGSWGSRLGESKSFCS